LGVASSASREESEEMYSGMSLVPMISSGSRSRLKEERWGGGKTRDHLKNQGANQGKNSLSNRALLWGAALLGLLAFVHGLGVFSSKDGGGDEK
jgi:hypothetical protein